MCQPAVILLALLLQPPTKPSDELKQLQGAWTLRGQDTKCVLVIEDDRWTLTWRNEGGGEQVEQGVVRLVETRGRPKVMDLIHDFGAYKGTSTRALYQIEGGVLWYSTLVVPYAIEDSSVVTAILTWQRKSTDR